MTVSDGDRFAIAMAKLSQARSAVYEATRIIEHLFESGGERTIPEDLFECDSSGGVSVDSCDSVTGLYPGQKQAVMDQDPEEETEECLE
jgi:hypothetical protein